MNAAPYTIASQNFHDYSRLFINPLSIFLTSSNLSSNILLIGHQFWSPPQPKFDYRPLICKPMCYRLHQLRKFFDLFIILSILAMLMPALYISTSCHARHSNLFPTLLKLPKYRLGSLKKTTPSRSYTIKSRPISLV